MATELCPAETNISRISFSDGFCSSSSSTMQQYSCPLPSTSSSLPLSSKDVDFQFDVRIDNIDQGCYSLADELFCHGKILPVQIEKRVDSRPSKQDQEEREHEHQPTRKPQHRAKTSSSKYIKVANGGQEMNNQNQSDPPKSSFWGFKRSSSLNIITGSKRLFSSSSTFLRRSSSAGSVSKAKSSSGPVLKDSQKEIKSFPFLQSSTKKPAKSHLKKNSSSYGSHCTVNTVSIVPLADVFCARAALLSSKGKKKC